MNNIVIYENGDVELKTTLKDDTVWLNQKQIAKLFEVNVSAISKHLNNIYNIKELDKKSTISKMEIVQKEGKRTVKRLITLYNLDIIISIGYRVNSKRATQFRIWATKILKEFMIKGYSLNQKKLQEKKLDELEKTVLLIKQGLTNRNISLSEAKGFIEIVSSYAKSWALLQGYDEQTLEEKILTTKSKFILDYDEAKDAIAELKKSLMQKGEASELFGREKANEFKGNLLNIYQSYGGVDLIPSIEAKAANLIYYIIKGHPFSDGNKRIGAYLFVLFLHKNEILYKENGESKINDNALVSLALLIAQSLPEQKDIIIKLIINMLHD